MILSSIAGLVARWMGVRVKDIGRNNVLLDEREKERFAAYCEQNVRTSKVIVEQMEKSPDPVIAELIKREKLKMAAFSIVAKDLREGETMKIGG